MEATKSISLQLMLGSRFRTSARADKLTNQMMTNLALTTRASVARLSLGRSLALGELTETADIDAKGLEIPATSLFSIQDLHIWAGLLVTHSSLYGSNPINSNEELRIAIRNHWHRGIHLLFDDWCNADESYEKFLSILISRRAGLPERSGIPMLPPEQQTRPVYSENDFSHLLQKSLSDLGVVVSIKSVTQGIRLTRYKVLLQDVSHFSKLKSNLSALQLALGLSTTPSIATCAEAKTLFLDIARPQQTWNTPTLSEINTWAKKVPSEDHSLLVFPAVDVLGDPITFDLSGIPHLLVGGATGQGKSICLHAIIASLITTRTPKDLKLALIDPKQVEFSIYQGSAYLLDNKLSLGNEAACETITQLTELMDKRYKTLSQHRVQNINELRRKGHEIPYIVVVIEELADLLLTDKNIEPKIVRLAQLARAAGIHLILATQRPDAKTFSGLIRSNIPGRIALTVQKATESNIILDDQGAESLLGAGDMLIKLPALQMIRGHGVYITRNDIEKIAKNPPQ